MVLYNIFPLFTIFKAVSCGSAMAAYGAAASRHHQASASHASAQASYAYNTAELAHYYAEHLSWEHEHEGRNKPGVDGKTVEVTVTKDPDCKGSMLENPQSSTTDSSRQNHGDPGAQTNSGGMDKPQILNALNGRTKPQTPEECKRKCDEQNLDSNKQPQKPSSTVPAECVKPPQCILNGVQQNNSQSSQPAAAQSPQIICEPPKAPEQPPKDKTPPAQNMPNPDSNQPSNSQIICTPPLPASTPSQPTPAIQPVLPETKLGPQTTPPDCLVVCHDHPAQQTSQNEAQPIKLSEDALKVGECLTSTIKVIPGECNQHCPKLIDFKKCEEHGIQGLSYHMRTDPHPNPCPEPQCAEVFIQKGDPTNRNNVIKAQNVDPKEINDAEINAHTIECDNMPPVACTPSVVKDPACEQKNNECSIPCIPDQSKPLPKPVSKNSVVPDEIILAKSSSSSRSNSESEYKTKAHLAANVKSPYGNYDKAGK